MRPPTRSPMGSARRGCRGQPRPGVPRPHRHDGRRARPRPAEGRGVRGGYAAYLGEREVDRRRAREGEREAARRSQLTERAGTQRAWMDKGVRDARRKATHHDKIGRRFRGEQTEKQAAKARQTERLIERMEVVEEPHKQWRLQMRIAVAPRAGAIVATARGVVVRRGSFTLGPADLQIDWADPLVLTGPKGVRQVDAARRPARASEPGRGVRHARARRRRRRDRPGEVAVHRRGGACPRFRRPRPAPGRDPVSR